MPIDTDDDLEAAVAKASVLLQQIQDYAQRDFTKAAKVRFPRGYLRTAAQARTRLGFLSSSHLKSNISYTMMLSDVQHWLRFVLRWPSRRTSIGLRHVRYGIPWLPGMSRGPGQPRGRRLTLSARFCGRNEGYNSPNVSPESYAPELQMTADALQCSVAVLGKVQTPTPASAALSCACG
mgnify:CR=1 FL=1